jgi:ribosomal protein S18 acetylase RimI-like enzyme
VKSAPRADPALRPATAADEAFLFRLYASTRAEELAATGWPAAQQEAFLRSQFAARAASYRASFPAAETRVILRGATPAGALIVHRTPEEIRLVDLALLPAHRGAGLGTRLLRALLAEAQASSRPLRLQVLKDNPAARLYARLGFHPTGNNGLHLRMEWLPSPA